MSRGIYEAKCTLNNTVEKLHGIGRWDGSSPITRVEAGLRRAVKEAVVGAGLAKW